MDDPRSRALITEIQAGYIGLYGGPDDAPVLAADFASPRGTFLLAADAQGHPVGCIGVRRHDPLTGEIKRMYVRPQVRRRGYARTLLAAAEDRARELGYRALVLETGSQQPEAVALYESLGYRTIPGYGHYRCSPQARSFRRDL